MPPLSTPTRSPGLKIVGIAIGDAGVGDADLRLVRLVGKMLAARKLDFGRVRGAMAFGCQSPNSRPTSSFSRGQSIRPATPRIVPLGA